MDNKIIEPYCEFQEMSIDEISGKAKIKMSAAKIHNADYEYQSNGINWVEQYVQNNIDSAKHMHYVVSWLDEENQIPKNHGVQEINEHGELVFSESVVVGDVRDAWIEEVVINSVPTKVLMTEGFINIQRYNKFYHWLKNEMQKGTIYGSVELRGKKNGKILYENNAYQNEDGSPLMGRKPQVFDFTDLAILYITTPADVASQVVEINNKESLLDNKEEKELDKDSNLNEKLIELNADLLNKNNEVNKLDGDLKAVNLELNNVKTDLSTKVAEIETLKVEKNDISATIVELNKKLTELEKTNAENNAELEELRKYKLDKEAEATKAEVNSYFENEITKNGFSETEVKDLKKFVETNDLNGLKDAEKELVLKKFKESIKKPEVETNQYMLNTSHKRKSNLDDVDFSL